MLFQLHEVQLLVRHSLQDAYELLNKTDLGFSQLLAFSIFINLNLMLKLAIPQAQLWHRNKAHFIEIH